MSAKQAAELTTAKIIPLRPRQSPQSLEIYQSHPNGMVAIEGIVPLALAHAMLRLIYPEL
jgi:hypothetical protein